MKTLFPVPTKPKGHPGLRMMFAVLRRVARTGHCPATLARAALRQAKAKADA